MIEQVEQQERRDVAVVSTASSAEFIAATLAVHGIPAAMAAFDTLYPSVTWAEGYRVTVAPEDHARAQALLAVLAIPVGEHPGRR